MATVSPALAQVENGPVQSVTWADMATGDTIEAVQLSRESALAASIQISGTFGGATVGLSASNDGSTYVALEDTSGDAISATAAAMFEVSTGALYLKPTISGGSSDAVDAVLVLR